MISHSYDGGGFAEARLALSQRERLLTSAMLEWANSTKYKVDDVLHFIQSEELRLPNGRVVDFRGGNARFEANPHEDFFSAWNCFEEADKALVIRIFANRLSELIEKVASSELRIDDQKVPDAWQKLFGFIGKLLIIDADIEIFNKQNGYCNISKAVVGLQESFDQAGTLPFTQHSDATRFSELLGALQSDDRFKQRWANILDSGCSWLNCPDLTLQTNYFGAWRAYCLMPNAASLDELRHVARRLCEITNAKYSSEEILNRQGASLVCTPSNSMDGMIPQVFGELKNEYPWLPQRPEVRREVEGKLRLLSESDGQKIADMCRLINETSGPLSGNLRPADWNTCLELARKIVSEYENKPVSNPPAYIPFDDMYFEMLVQNYSQRIAEISKKIYEICGLGNTTPRGRLDNLEDNASMVIAPYSAIESAAQAEIPIGFPGVSFVED
jgi:hypothetical protein